MGAAVHYTLGYGWNYRSYRLEEQWWKPLGEVGLPGLRLRAFCPPHVPVYTLRRGPTLGRHTPDVVRVMRW